MRVTMDLSRRSMDAAMHLRRAIELRAKANDRTMSEVSKEMAEEAGVHETIAYELLDYTIEIERSAGSLIVPTPNIDLKQLDATSKGTADATNS